MDSIENDFYIKVVSKRDGAYLVINNPYNQEKLDINDIMNILKKYEVKNIDEELIKDTISLKLEKIDIKVSDDNNIHSTDEQLEIIISSDNMQGMIKFIEPINGKIFDYDKFRDIINKSEIKFGINEEKIKECFEEHSYNTEYLIANAEPKVDDIDGRLKINFEVKKKTNKPRVLDDGTVDFKDLSLFLQTKEGEVLIELIKPEVGKDGTDVRGNTISRKIGKEVNLPSIGKNVELIDNNMKIISKISGEIIYNGKKIDISNTLDIKGNVDNSTGNIDFNGNIIIKGMVATGFFVKATGKIEVNGVVEGASIYSDSDIFLYAGVQGTDKAIITSNGDIVTKYATNCTLNSKGNIVSDSIMHSKVVCGGNLTLVGKNGTILGGEINVKRVLQAENIGSSMATNTNIIVGDISDDIEEYKEMITQYDNFKSIYESLKISIDDMINRKDSLEKEEKLTLVKYMETKKVLKDRLIFIKNKIDKINIKISKNNGEIIFNKVMHSGVIVKIGNSVYLAEDKLYKSKMKVINNKISIIRI